MLFHREALYDNRPLESVGPARLELSRRFWGFQSTAAKMFGDSKMMSLSTLMPMLFRTTHHSIQLCLGPDCRSNCSVNATGPTAPTPPQNVTQTMVVSGPF